MLDHFIYSLNATLPVFLIIVLGWGLRRAKLLGEGFVLTANKLTYTVTLPVMLFLEIAQMDAGALLDLKFLGFGFFPALHAFCLSGRVCACFLRIRAW